MPRHKKHWLGASLRMTKGSFCVRRLGGCYGHPKKVASPYRSMSWRIEAAVLAGYWSDVLHRHLECTQRTTSPATLLHVRFKFTKATSNSSSFSSSSSSVSKVLSEPPDSLEDTGIASPKSKSRFGKVTPPLFTVSRPWTSEKDHSSYPWSLRIEPRTYRLEVRWINHWATGTLSKGLGRNQPGWGPRCAVPLRWLLLLPVAT